MTPTKVEKLAKQLKYQQHQINTLVGQVKNLVSLVRATQPSSSVARTGGPYYGRGHCSKKLQGTGREGSWGKGQPSQPRTTFQPKVRSPNKSRGLLKLTS